MKALSIRQPWAWAILNAGKDIENRNWKTRFRGRVLIHAGKTFDDDGHMDLCIKQMRGEFSVPSDEIEFKTGGIVGSVDIVDCVSQSDSEWFVGKYGFVLRNPRPLPFYSCKGQLNFFEVNYS